MFNFLSAQAAVVEMTSDGEDRELLRRFLLSRDEGSFRALYKSVTPSLYAFALRYCGSAIDADELVQETWSRAVPRLSDFRGESRLTTWLTAVLLNCAREQARSAGRRRLNPAPDSDIQNLSVTGATAEAVDLNRALAALPDGFREVVLLHDVHGYTHAEIGQMLGVAAGTSKSQLNRGRLRLRELLAGGKNHE